MCLTNRTGIMSMCCVWSLFSVSCIAVSMCTFASLDAVA